MSINRDTSGQILRERLIEHLGAELVSTYDCDRVWGAWSVGTMSASDFTETNDRLDDLVSGISAIVEESESSRIQELLEANNRYLERARIAEGTERKARDARQAAQMRWAHETFGGIENFDPCSIQERARRFLEEALELVQSLGVTAEESSHVLDYVFGREAGETFQEFGGTALTLGCLAQAAGISVCEAEIAEFDRVQRKSKAHFEARHRAKMEAGL